MTLLQESKAVAIAGAAIGCCFETLNPPLTGRKQSHHETESSNLLSPKSLGARHHLGPSTLPSSAILARPSCANHRVHTPLAPSLESTNTLMHHLHK
jgi:hypothetical protein